MPLAEQENEIFSREYLPFDAEGKPILLKYDEVKGKYIHVFPGQSDWQDPIVDAVRRDAKDYREPMTPTGKLIRGSTSAGVSRNAAQGSGAGAASAVQTEEPSCPPPPPLIRPRQSQSQSRSASINMEIAQRARREREGKEKEAQAEEQRRASGMDAEFGKGSGEVKKKEEIKLERAYDDEDAGGSAKAVGRVPSGGGFTAANRQEYF